MAFTITRYSLTSTIVDLVAIVPAKSCLIADPDTVTELGDLFVPSSSS